MASIRKLSRITLILFSLLFLSTTIQGKKNNPENYYVSSSELSKDNGKLNVNILFDFHDLKLGGNQAIVLTPVIVNGRDSVECEPVAVYGRAVWYQMERKVIKPFPSEQSLRLRVGKKLKTQVYSQSLALQGWMNNASLVIRKDFYNCVGCNQGEEMSAVIATYAEPVDQADKKMESQQNAPGYRPETGRPELFMKVKSSVLSTSVQIDFPVDDYKVDAGYKDNPEALKRIKDILESLLGSQAVEIKSLSVKAMASPDGPYELNADLAYRRALALKDYLTANFNIPESDIKTSYQPIDWQGLRKWVETHEISDKSGILSILNSNLPISEWNARIKEKYPQVYDELLRNVYPDLRQATFTIEYQIKEN